MHRRMILLLAILILVALQGPLYWFQNGTVLEQMITGPDSFMRLQRVMDLHAGGAWYDAYQPRTNAPYGETLHWTRPMDALLFAGAWVGSAFTDFRTALMLWGVALSPLLLAAGIFVWSWGTRKLLDDTAFLMSVAMLVLLPTLNVSFKLGRPDHHSLLMFLFICQLVVFFRIALGQGTTRLAIAGGVTGGLAIWVSPESLTHLLLFGGALGVYWLWQGGEHIRTMTTYLVAMAGMLVVAMVVERPPAQWLTPQYDRLSIVHLALLISGALGWVIASAVHRRTQLSADVRGRAIIAFVGCIVPAIVMLTAFPKFYAGPFAEISSEAFDEWIDVIAEYHPIVPVDRFTTGMFIAHLSPAFIVLAYVYMRWRQADAPERRLIVLWLIGLAMFFPMALDAIRWSMYVQALIWLPWTLAIIALVRHPWDVTLKRIKIPVNAVVAPALVLGPVFGGMAILPPKEAEAAKRSCDWPAIARHVETLRPAGAEGQLLFTHFFRGPEFVWRTGYRVVGAPYGNDRSLRDTNTLFRAKDEAAAKQMIEERKADLVLICPVGPERRRYVKKDEDSFYVRLESGKAPGWLAKVTLPDALAGSFRLYKVIR